MKLRHSPLRIFLLVLGILAILGVIIVALNDRKQTRIVSEKPFQERINVVLSEPETRIIVKQEKTYEYRIEYPFFNNSVVDSEIQSYVDAVYTSFETDLKQAYVPELLSQFVPIAEIDYQIKKSGTVTTVVFNGYQYTGGAHPNSFVHTIAFEGEQKILLDSLFAVPQSEYLPRLQSISTTVLEQKIGKESLFYEGLEPRIENYQHWYVLENDLVILFSPYQVGPYAIGMPEVTIPFAQIQDILE